MLTQDNSATTAELISPESLNAMDTGDLSLDFIIELLAAEQVASESHRSTDVYPAKELHPVTDRGL